MALLVALLDLSPSSLSEEPTLPTAPTPLRSPDTSSIPTSLTSPQTTEAFIAELKRQQALVNNTEDAEGKKHKAKQQAHFDLYAAFPVLYDWWMQDGENLSVFTPQDWDNNRHDAEFYNESHKNSLHWFDGPFSEALQTRLNHIAEEINTPHKIQNDDSDEVAILRYVELCLKRRELRLAHFLDQHPNATVVFSKYAPLRPSFFAYTEGVSEARAESNFIPGTELAYFTMRGPWAEEHSLIKDTKGVIRDLNVHFDGTRLLFAWKKDFKTDDYHLYEMTFPSKEIRQLTEGQGTADIEGIYLPDDNIMFNSTRCGTSVDCWYTEVSNLFLCDPNGKFIRQIGFDQVHTPHPALMNDGRVVYTRWDYNDRGQVFTQPLFQMNPDGTGQAEYYGMNSWFPTTTSQVAPIPGSRKIMAILLGHHTPQHGKLALIDPEAGRDENEGVTLLAPTRPAQKYALHPDNPNTLRDVPAADYYGRHGDQFLHPYPLSERELLVSYSPLGYFFPEKMIFGIYWMNAETGDRELLVMDSALSSNHPKLLAPRQRPFVRYSNVDYTQDNGTYYLQDIYQGNGLKGIPKGAVKQLRIVEIEFKSAGVGSSYNNGNGGGALSSTPASIGRGAWDIKKIHGTVTVHPDGSAFFKAPARRPLYFQALDENGSVIQTMRSWSTLQPNEFQSCVGCHEHKNSVPPAQHSPSQAMNAGPEEMAPYPGGVRGFSFIKEVQPILDKHCIACHNGTDHEMDLRGEFFGSPNNARRLFSKSYISLTHPPKDMDPNSTAWQGDASHPEVNWINCLSEPGMLPPYSAGSATSKLIKRLREGHKNTKITPEEINTIATWIDLLVPFVGDYQEAADWDQGAFDYYRRFQQKREDIRSDLNTQLEAYKASRQTK